MKDKTKRTKKPMSAGVALGIFVPIIAILLALFVAIIALSCVFWQDLSLWFGGRAQNTDEKVLTQGTALCEDITEEGVVLLKNENKALPLTGNEKLAVNVFGWAAYDWMCMAFGSGYSNTSLERVKLFPALKEAGIEYNEDLYNLYQSFYSNPNKVYGDGDMEEYRGGVSFGSEAIFTLHEPGKDKYTEAIKTSIRNTSDVALVVLGRTGSESKDLQLQQVRQNQNGTDNTTNKDRNYLELSPEEAEMIEVAKETCEKVIVILNTANTMEVGFIDDPEIDAALLVGLTGLTGTRGLINVLLGEKQVEEKVPEVDGSGNPVKDDDGNIVYKKDDQGNILTEKKTIKVSPSGRTADTYAYDITTAPSFVNSGFESSTGRAYSSGGQGYGFNSYVDYSEGIYVGYKWYETANVEGYWDDVDNEYGKGYDGVVQYPFGYGLSYTDFEWTVERTRINDNVQNGGTLPKDATVSVDVKVKNVGDYPGMDVVELYYTPNYKKGGIEKASVNLADFVKTPVLDPDEECLVTLKTTVQSMASYDCYDKNGNGHTGYELDGGDHILRVMKNAHESVQDITFTIPNEGYNYDTDEKTGKTVENRFTNKDGDGNDEAIDNNDLDGSRETTPVVYMTREEFVFPKNDTRRAMSAEALQVAQNGRPTDDQLDATGYYGIAMPSVGEPNGLVMEDVLELTDYDNALWEDVVHQITKSELFTLVKDGYFKTAEIKSLGKPEYVDLDGPLGFNTRVTGGNGTTCDFVAYPSATLMAQTWDVALGYAYGLSVGAEAASTPGLHGWYAPGANIHRNPYGGRNGEYYSEDGVLSGKICAETVRGAKDKGVYSYVQHFVCNDSEANREGLFTFVTEQALRELYLKPFEIIIKDGGGNALMTAMNRLGRTWSGATRGLCTDIIRNEWGFRGTLVTDWVNGAGEESIFPAYKGIWAGNDIWLSNGSALFSDSTYNNEAPFVALAQNVAHDVLYTFADTMKAANSYDPNNSQNISSGAQYDTSWIWYLIFPVELVIFIGIGLLAFFLIRNLLLNKKYKKGQLQ